MCFLIKAMTVYIVAIAIAFNLQSRGSSKELSIRVVSRQPRK